MKRYPQYILKVKKIIIIKNKNSSLQKNVSSGLQTGKYASCVCSHKFF